MKNLNSNKYKFTIAFFVKCVNIILENIAIRNFAGVQLITAHTKDFITIIVLLAISAFVILLEIVVKYLKIAQQNKETK